MIQSFIDHEADQLLKEQQQKIEDEQEYGNLNFEHYHFAVNQKFDFKTRKNAQKKLIYVFTEAFSDLGVQNFWTVEF